MAGSGWQVYAGRVLNLALRSGLLRGGRPGILPRVPPGTVPGRSDGSAPRGTPSVPRPAERPTGPARQKDGGSRGHLGEPDFTGVSTVTYAPHPDGLPDPGEVVWTWVAYEEDLRRGKDRPVLVVGRDGAFLLALMLTSRDHDGPGSDQADEERYGRHWVDLGPGAWDTRGRPSQVRLDRVLQVDPAGVRREGATLDRDRFDLVAQRLRDEHGWS